MNNQPFQEPQESYVLRDPAQLRALGAPASRAVFQGLLRIGKGSIKEIGATIGKSPHSIYHHMDKLVGVGLVLEAGEIKSGARTEKLYRPVSHLLATDPNNRTPEYLEAIADNAAAGYRQAERSLRRALEDGRANKDPDQPNALALQFTVPLSQKQRAQLVRRINELVVDFTSELDFDEEGDFHIVTLGLSPSEKM